MLTDDHIPDTKLRASFAGVGNEAVRVQHEVPVPLLRNLDAVDAAVVLAEKRLRAWERLELRVVGHPLLDRARHRRHARPAERARRRRKTDGHPRQDQGSDQRANPHSSLLSSAAAPLAYVRGFAGSANDVRFAPEGMTTYCRPSMA